MDSECLEHFKLARFRFYLEPQEPLYLPPYKGAALRGGLGSVFKRTVCVSPDHDCTRCLLRGQCAYSYIFETVPSERVKASYALSDYPHPFILEPPSERKSEYPPGDVIAFNLILIGEAIEYLPYFVFVYRELGRTGLGKGRAKYILRQVQSTSEGTRTIYEAGSEVLRSDFHIGTFAELMEEGETSAGGQGRMGAGEIPSAPLPLCSSAGVSLCLRFLTPTRIKHGGRLTKEIDFKILMRNLLRRIILLDELHCGGKSDLDCEGLLKAAERIKTTHNTLRWRDWERYSSRQQTRMKLGGFTGRICFEGDLEVFMPFIRLGEYIHVGKGTSFGLGQYEIVMED